MESQNDAFFRSRFSWGFALCLLLGCTTMKDAQPPLASKNEMPQKPPLAPDATLLEADRLTQIRDFPAVQTLLLHYEARDSLAKLWQRWLLGQALMERGGVEQGFALLEANYQDLRDHAEGWSPDAFRVAARSLKKLGWYYRQKGEFERAYTIHHLQYLFLCQYGSAEDRHDALISLDFDSFELKQSFASEHWLREALAVAAAIPDELSRTKALATSWNNLSDTLRLQKRWIEAVQAGLESQTHWRTWDQSNASKERREIWALLQTADVYKNWSEHLQAADPKAAKDKFRLAREQAMAANVLKAQLTLDAAEEKDFEARLTPYLQAIR